MVVEEDTHSEHSEDQDEQDTNLTNIMIQLVARSAVDLEKLAHEKRDPREVADLLHDSLVKVWDTPQREDGEHVQVLKERATVWQQHRKPPPMSSESPAAPVLSPGAAQRHSGVSGPAAKALQLDKQWPETHTLG